MVQFLLICCCCFAIWHKTAVTELFGGFWNFLGKVISKNYSKDHAAFPLFRWVDTTYITTFKGKLDFWTVFFPVNAVQLSDFQKKLGFVFQMHFPELFWGCTYCICQHSRKTIKPTQAILRNFTLCKCASLHFLMHWGLGFVLVGITTGAVEGKAISLCYRDVTRWMLP